MTKPKKRVSSTVTVSLLHPVANKDAAPPRHIYTCRCTALALAGSQPGLALFFVRRATEAVLHIHQLGALFGAGSSGKKAPQGTLPIVCQGWHRFKANTCPRTFKKSIRSCGYCPVVAAPVTSAGCDCPSPSPTLRAGAKTPKHPQPSMQHKAAAGIFPDRGFFDEHLRLCWCATFSAKLAAVLEKRLIRRDR